MPLISGCRLLAGLAGVVACVGSGRTSPPKTAVNVAHLV